MLHSSWLLFWGIIGWLVAVEVVPHTYPEHEHSTRWLRSLWTNVLLLGSVALHELAHLLVALRMRMSLQRVVLFPFGGVLTLKRRPASWREALLLAAAGPLASIIIGILLLVVAPAGTRPLATWVGLFNVALALLNLLPAEPLDGADLLRALGQWRGTSTGKLTRFSFRLADALGTALVWTGLAAVVIVGRIEPLLLILFGCLFQLANNVYRLKENPRRRRALRQISMKTVLAALRSGRTAAAVTGREAPPSLEPAAGLQPLPPASASPILGNDAISPIPVPGDGPFLAPAAPPPLSPWSVPAEAALLEALDHLDRPETPTHLLVVEGHKIVGSCSRADLLHYLSRIPEQPP